MRGVIVWCGCLAACGRIGFEATPTADDALLTVVDTMIDGDAGPPTGMFGPPQLLFPRPSAAFAIDDPTLTGDLLELYFAMQDASGTDIYAVTRTDQGAAWGSPGLIAELSDPAQSDTNPEITPDGLMMFVSIIEDTPPVQRASTRATRAATWSTPSPVGFAGHGLTVDATRTVGIFHRNSGTGNDLLEATRATAGDAWGAPMLRDELSVVDVDESNAFLDASGLHVIYQSNIDDSSGDLYSADRASIGDAFGAPTPIAELNTTFAEGDPWLSPDLRTIVFVSDRDGVAAFYIATR